MSPASVAPALGLQRLLSLDQVGMGLPIFERSKKWNKRRASEEQGREKGVDEPKERVI